MMSTSSNNSNVMSRRILAIIVMCSMFAFINQTAVQSSFESGLQVGSVRETNKSTTTGTAPRTRPSDDPLWTVQDDETTTTNTTTSSSDSSLDDDKHSHTSETSQLQQQPPSFLPLYVGAGQGTTGTRSLYDAMCRLGIPSVHYKQYCIHPNINTDNESMNKSSSSTLQSLKHGVHAHQRALVYWMQLTRCVMRARPQYVDTPSYCNMTTFDHYVDQLRLWVRQLVHSGIGSIHDVPYSHMVPFIVDIAHSIETSSSDAPSSMLDTGDNQLHHHKPRGSIMLLTERHPDEWIASRVKHHPKTADLICSPTSSSDDSHNSTNDPIDAFDLDECIERHHSSNSIHEMLYSPKQIREDSPEREQEFVRLSRDAMDAYQRKIVDQYQPALRVNFWEHAYDDETLSHAVWNATRHLLTTNTTILKDLETLASNGGLHRQRIKSFPDLVFDELKNGQEQLRNEGDHQP